MQKLKVKFHDLLKSLFGGEKILVIFRNINISLFLASSVLIVAVIFLVLQNISHTVSKDYAKLYAANTAGKINTYFGREIALVKNAASSNEVMDWFSDENNKEKKLAAFEELIRTMGVLTSDNIYIGMEKTLHEFTVEEDFTVEDVEPFATLEPDYYDDAWYFECTASDKEYLLNVDIDKILHRKRVWLNYKVVRDGQILGVLCTGLEFSGFVEELFSEYDSRSVRGLIIDENGAISMDSFLLGNDRFLNYTVDGERLIENEFSDPYFLTAAKEYLDGIDGYFDTKSPSVVIELSKGQFRYATIAPIASTTWSVVTLYNSSSLFNMAKLLPLFILLPSMFIVFIAATSLASNKLIFSPFEKLIGSIMRISSDKSVRIYGSDRRDEIGELSRTIQGMKDRLDSYNTDLENEVALRSAALRSAYEKTNEQNRVILDSIDYASKIQKNLLPETSLIKDTFKDYAVIWKPRDVVGGDIYWLKSFGKGTVLCVCDCTGHGTPGALLTMLVVSAFEAIVNEDNYMSPAQVLFLLDKRISNILNVKAAKQQEKRRPNINDGCDLAVLFIAKDGGISIASSKTHVFICDGSEVTQIKGQRLFVGEGSINSAEDVRVTNIPANPDNKFYIATDGLFEQIGGELERPFGYKTFKQIILENHDGSLSQISEKIWSAFENYRGNQSRRDDVQLISFSPYLRRDK